MWLGMVTLIATMPQFTLDSNLTQLPWGKFALLAQFLNENERWKAVLLGGSTTSASSSLLFGYRHDEIGALALESNPGESLLRGLGNRGVNVRQLLARFHALSRSHGPSFDWPQLFLGRKFAPVRFTKSPSVTTVGDGTELEIRVSADGFPYPTYQWYRDDNLLEGPCSSLLRISRCSCCIGTGLYKCKISNEIDLSFELSAQYRKNGKQFQSEMFSDGVDLTKYCIANTSCDRCKQSDLAKLCDLVVATNLDQIEHPTAGNSHQENVDIYGEGDTLFAADKVALIISNSEYWHLPPLLTPPCDAESLSVELQSLDFKTVTLADMTLAEMQLAIREYRRLLGYGVYAVFYFVGHGFEANGQCYLLPVDAPRANDYKPTDCLSVDWVLSVMQDHSPALNLILLDVCRKYLPSDMKQFAMQQTRYELKVNRNTVFGYATSGGVGAYEVRGDTNGVFMKYLKNHLKLHKPVTEVLHRVMRDLENDPKASDVQFPELRTNLSKMRSLADSLVYDGHTVSFDHHTIEWQLIHELPDPVRVRFCLEKLLVTMWFDFCGHFTNMVYVFSSVADLVEDEHTAGEDLSERKSSEYAREHLAYVQFGPDLESVHTTVCQDDMEGESVRTLLKHIQRAKGPIVNCSVELRRKTDESVVASSKISLGHLLITRLYG